MNVLTVGNKDFRMYAKGNLYCHVLAFRVSTAKSVADLLVTDYTSNPNIQDERLGVPSFQDLEISPDQILHLTLSIEQLKRLALEYQSRYDEEFFSKLDAHLTQTNWVILQGKLCFANLHVSVHKKLPHLTGLVDQQFVLSRLLVNVLPFWERVLHNCGQIMTSRPNLAAKVISNLSDECRDRATHVLGSLAVVLDSTSYSTGESQTQVKTEHSLDEMDLQNQLRDILEPVSQPAQVYRHSQTQTQYLTQLQSLNSQLDSQFRDGPSQSQSDGSNLQENNAELHQDDNLFASEPLIGQSHTLAQLNRVPLLPNSRIYHTEAYVVGTIPKELMMLCTKKYNVENGQIALTDPIVESLQLVLLDLELKLLTPENLLLVWVSRDEIMEFMGLKYHEQLYTRLAAFQELLRNRKLKKIPLELSITSETGIAQWTTRKLSFDNLVKH